MNREKKDQSRSEDAFFFHLQDVNDMFNDCF